jgi:hypothetical protein
LLYRNGTPVQYMAIVAPIVSASVPASGDQGFLHPVASQGGDQRLDQLPVATAALVMNDRSRSSRSACSRTAARFRPAALPIARRLTSQRLYLLADSSEGPAGARSWPGQKIAASSSSSGSNASPRSGGSGI